MQSDLVCKKICTRPSLHCLQVGGHSLALTMNRVSSHLNDVTLVLGTLGVKLTKWQMKNWVDLLLLLVVLINY